MEKYRDRVRFQAYYNFTFHNFLPHPSLLHTSGVNYVQRKKIGKKKKARGVEVYVFTLLLHPNTNKIKFTFTLLLRYLDAASTSPLLYKQIKQSGPGVFHLYSLLNPLLQLPGHELAHTLLMNGQSPKI